MAQLNKSNLMPGLFGEIPKKPQKSEQNDDLIVDIDKLLDFHSEVIPGRAHPFRRIPNEKKEELKKSISEDGLLYPIKIRKDSEYEGFYEIIAGHNRRDALKELGRETLSAAKGEIELIEADDTKAINQMIATNIQRDEIYIMDKAWAYRVWLENNKNKREGVRNDQRLADESGDSRANIQRYVRLTYLIQDLQTLVDDKSVPVNVGVEISYFSNEQQNVIYDYMASGKKINLEQIKKLRTVSEQITDIDSLNDFLDDEKPQEPIKRVFKTATKYFKNYDEEKIKRIDPMKLEDIVKAAVEKYLAEL